MSRLPVLSLSRFMLKVHEKGRSNYVELYTSADKLYLLTCDDDRTVQSDYHSESCVQALEGCTSKSSFTLSYPNLPLIISGSEDGTIRFWNSRRYRPETALSCAFERPVRQGVHIVSFGYDEGLVVIKIGRDEPSLSNGSIRDAHLYPQYRLPFHKSADHW